MKILKIILYTIFLLTVGCGGGSEGTGTSSSIKKISGSVFLDNGTPLSQATVTVLETGDGSPTGANGEYLIATETEASALTLEIQKDDIKGSTQITGLSPESSSVQADLVITPRGDASLVAIGYLEIFARIINECEKYFSNKAIIKQVRNVPDNLRCTLRFSASGDGKPLERIRGRIEVRTCKPTDPWRQIAEGLTGTGSEIGYGDIDFDFIDNRNNCLYRLISPIDDPNARQTEIFIETKTYQER